MAVFFTGMRLKYRHDAPIQSKLQHLIKQMFKQNFFMELHGGFFLINRARRRQIYSEKVRFQGLLQCVTFS